MGGLVWRAPPPPFASHLHRSRLSEIPPTQSRAGDSELLRSEDGQPVHPAVDYQIMLPAAFSRRVRSELTLASRMQVGLHVWRWLQSGANGDGTRLIDLGIPSKEFSL